MVFDVGGMGDEAALVFGSDHKRKWSPDVAKRSVNGFEVVGGSQRTRVIGYVCEASATLVNSTAGG